MPWILMIYVLGKTVTFQEFYTAEACQKAQQILTAEHSHTIDAFCVSKGDPMAPVLDQLKGMTR